MLILFSLMQEADFFLPPKIMLFIKCNSGVIREDFRDLCQSLKLCNPSKISYFR